MNESDTRLQQLISFESRLFTKQQIDGQYFGARFQIDPLGSLTNSTIQNQKLITYTDGGTNEITLNIDSIDSTDVSMSMQILTSTFSGIFTWSTPILSFNNGVHFGIIIDDTYIADSQIYVDGLLISPTITETGSFTNNEYDFYYLIGSPDNSGFMPLAISDFRASTVAPRTSDIPNISRGYLYLDMELIFGLTFTTAGNFVNSGTDGQSAYGTPSVETGTVSPTKNIQTNLIPDIGINILGSQDNSFQLQLFAPGWQSIGRTLQPSSLRLFYNEPWDSSGILDVTNAFHEKFGYYPIGLATNFAIRLVDYRTGQATIKSNGGGGKRRRGFKAGSELAGKVN